MWGYYHRQLGGFLSTLAMKHVEELRPLEKALGCTIEEFCKKQPTYPQFDGAITAPTYGYSSADDYYRKTSGVLKIGTIKTPTLFINAYDDPIVWYYSPNILGVKSYRMMNA